MQMEIRGKNVKVSEERRQLIEKKLGKLERYMENMEDATVELGTERNGKAGEGRLVIEMTLRGPANGTLLRAEERDNDLGVALDRLYEKMHKQVTRYKERMVHHKGRMRVSEIVDRLAQAEQPQAQEKFSPAEITETLDVVKVKQFQVKPLFVDEALEQMELLGHNFFIFQDVDNGHLSVAYRRTNGGYGILRPEVE